MVEAKGSVCYVLPSYQPDGSEHFAHLPRFLTRLARDCNLYVIVERGHQSPLIPGAREVILQTSPPQQRLRRYLELVRVVRQLQKKGCTKVFVRISRGSALVLTALSRLIGIEVFYWNSGQGRAAWPSWGKFGKRLRLEVDDLVTRLILLLTHHFVTGPESMLEYYTSNYGIRPEKGIILYNDIDSNLFRPSDDRGSVRKHLGLREDLDYLLFVGRISNYKGGDRLFQVMKDLEVRGARCELFAIGAGHLKDATLKLRQATQIKYLGAMPNSDVLLYYQACDIFILPSRSEGFPRVLLEAMACALPVVAFDVGGVRDLLGPLQQKFVVPANDVEELVNRTEELILHQELRQELARENMRMVRRYSTDLVAQQFIERIVRR